MVYLLNRGDLSPSIHHHCPAMVVHLLLLLYLPSQVLYVCLQYNLYNDITNYDSLIMGILL